RVRGAASRGLRQGDRRRRPPQPARGAPLRRGGPAVLLRPRPRADRRLRVRRMSLLVLFRTRLEWCNYTCHYCPWNASVHKLPPEAFRADEARLNRVLGRVAELPQRVEFFITPKAEYLVLPYWRAAVARLLALPQVERVTVQTNLSFDLAEFLDQVGASKLA